MFNGWNLSWSQLEGWVMGVAGWDSSWFIEWCGWVGWVNSKSCASLGWKKGAGCFNKERGWFTWSKGVVLVEIISISRFLWPKKLTKSGFPLGETIRKTFLEPWKKMGLTSVSIFLSAETETAIRFARMDLLSSFEKRSTLFSCRHFWILRFAQDRQMKKYEVPKFPKNPRIWCCLDSQVSRDLGSCYPSSHMVQ